MRVLASLSLSLLGPSVVAAQGVAPTFDALRRKGTQAEIVQASTTAESTLTFRQPGFSQTFVTNGRCRIQLLQRVDSGGRVQTSKVVADAGDFMLSISHDSLAPLTQPALRLSLRNSSSTISRISNDSGVQRVDGLSVALPAPRESSQASSFKRAIQAFLDACERYF